MLVNYMKQINTDLETAQIRLQAAELITERAYDKAVSDRLEVSKINTIAHRLAMITNSQKEIDKAKDFLLLAIKDLE